MHVVFSSIEFLSLLTMVKFWFDSE